MVPLVVSSQSKPARVFYFFKNLQVFKVSLLLNNLFEQRACILAPLFGVVFEDELKISYVKPHCHVFRHFLAKITEMIFRHS